MAPRTLKNPFGMPTNGTSGPRPMMPAQNAVSTVLTPAAQRARNEAARRRSALQRLMHNRYGK